MPGVENGKEKLITKGHEGVPAGDGAVPQLAGGGDYTIYRFAKTHGTVHSKG